MCARGKSKKIYGPSATIPSRFLGLFSLNHKEIKLLIGCQVKQESTHLPYHFYTRLNDMDDVIVRGGVIARPLQFPLGKLPTMTSIIEKQGSGWENINEKTFFKQSEGYQREDVVMLTLKQYEECYIMFSMMKYIKMTIRSNEK